MVSLQEKNPAEGIENLNELASNEPEIRFLPTNVLLSLSTVPLLFGLWGGKSLSGFVEGLSEVCEELFRGDRLPVLRFPSPTEPTDTEA